MLGAGSSEIGDRTSRQRRTGRGRPAVRDGDAGRGRRAGHRKAAVWSKILPFVLLIWALTGAFYPAVDLCAGEKERGTLETLLSSPAERSEIVLGKLLTVMLFSMATAMLNLVSMGVTGRSCSARCRTWARRRRWPSRLAAVALVPVSALFSALCLALAAFARSTKEGQYYLMPLVLVTMPLTILPMAPGVELNLGNSLIPITGVVLLLRSMLEGNYWRHCLILPLVVAVTLACCLLAIRWASISSTPNRSCSARASGGTSACGCEHLIARPGCDAQPGRGHVLRHIDPPDSILYQLQRPHSAYVSGFRCAGGRHAVGRDRHARTTDDRDAHAEPRTDLATAPAAVGRPVMAVLLAMAMHPSVNALQAVVTRVYPLNEEVARN